jgi:hypothetical protein
MPAAPQRERQVLPPWAAPAAVALITLVVALATVSPYLVGSFQDDGIYVILGRALATGAGYRYLHLPGQPAATHYPPGYPALLAILWKIGPSFPGNIVTFERANAVLLAAAAALGVMLARRAGLSTPWASVVALGGTASIQPLALASMVLSESCFLAVLLAALVATEAVIGGGRAERDVAGQRWTGVWQGCGAGMLCGAVVLVRTVGGVLLPAALGVCLIRKQWRTALALAGGALAVTLPWQLWVWAHAGDLAPILQGKYGSYSGWLTGALRRHGLGFALATVHQNLGDLAATFAVQLAPGLPGPIKVFAVVACILLLVWGAVRLAPMTPVTVAFGAIYAAEVLLWPFPPFRFVWAVWLLLVLVLVKGATAILQWKPIGRGARGARISGLVVAGIVGVCLVRYNVMGYRHHWWNTMQESLSIRTARPLDWISAHPGLPPVTVSDNETSIYLYTGRVGIPCNAFTPDEYIYPRDTAHDRVVLDAALRRFPIGSVIATGPACALAALSLAAEPGHPLIPVDTAWAGLAVLVRSHQ